MRADEQDAIEAGRPVWGKTGADGRPAHHLAHHAMDVAAVLERLLAHPVLAARAATAAERPLSDAERAWLAAFAFLHDVGKLSPAFQAKAWPEAAPGSTRSHLAEGAGWLEGLHRRRDALGGQAMSLLDPLIRAGLPTWEAWTGALLAHHGRPVELSGRFTESAPSGYDWAAEERRLGEALATWFPAALTPDACDPAILCRPRLVHLFAGLLALADWIGSDAAAFPHMLTLDVAGYAALARRQASAALGDIGL